MNAYNLNKQKRVDLFMIRSKPDSVPLIYHLKKWPSHSMKESDAKIQWNKITIQEIWITRKFPT